MSESIKQHLDEFACDQFLVELRQPKVILLFQNYTRVITTAFSVHCLCALLKLEFRCSYP